MIGLRFKMRMAGTYHLFCDATKDLSMTLDVDVELRDVRRVVGDRIGDVKGTIDVEGIGVKRPVTGTIRYLFDEKRVPYDLVFTSQEGRTLRLRGQHDIYVMNLLGALTTLPASLYDASGDEVGRAILRFDLKGDLARSLRSLRPIVRRSKKRQEART